ncbi:hypothetical protein ACFRAI_22220 [Streptomyces sp. NPDC056637]|uniref:hypothetical protein n=1 Tax=unclassified Streptomyces TaxID=2593676 RepID=UPI0036B757E0
MSADDAKGGGAESPAVSGGVFGAVGAAAAGVTAAAAQAMRVEGETLTAFKRRVDALLRDLEKSHAAPSKIAGGTLGAGRLGTFDEADQLHSSYTHVHTQLANLSKMLSLQIEALVVTVDASKTGYHNLDDDVRARLSRIRTNVDALVGGGQHTKQPSDKRGSDGEERSEPSPEATDREAGGL